MTTDGTGSTPRRPYWERHREWRHREFLDTALDIVTSDGLSALTMKRVTNALGCSEGAIYQYFPSKDALVGAVLDERGVSPTLSTSGREATLPVKSDSRMAPMTLKILELLDDGEWHEQEQIINDAMYITPPGEAFRFGQALSQAVHDRRSQDEIIASGMRSRAVTSLNSLIQNDRVEREGVEPGQMGQEEKRVRLKSTLPVVYLTRDRGGTLSVHTSHPQKVAVHILDAWTELQEGGETNDPADELEQIEALYRSMPRRIEGKDRLDRVFRQLMNGLSVRKTFRPPRQGDNE